MTWERIRLLNVIVAIWAGTFAFIGTSKLLTLVEAFGAGVSMGTVFIITLAVIPLRNAFHDVNSAFTLILDINQHLLDQMNKAPPLDPS